MSEFDELFTNNSFDNYTDKVIREMLEDSEKRAFQECLDGDKIIETVLIASRKQQQWLVPLIKLGIVKAVLWTDLAEDKVYQVMDPIMRENIIKMNEEFNL